MISYLIEHNRWINIIGILAVIGSASLMSSHKKSIDWRLVLKALALHIVIAYGALRTSIGNYILSIIAQGIKNLYCYADQGSAFLFGNLTYPDAAWGFVFAFKVLPIVIFFGALMSLLFYIGIVQRLVYGLNYVFQPLLGTSGPETLCAVANSFLGQTESPLLIRHYLASMTPSEIFVVMVSGMATISGSILAVFASMGIPAVHLLAASVMAIPASIMIAKIILPQTESYETTPLAIHTQSEASNALEAIAIGTSEGLSLALNIGAMLIAFISLISLVDTLIIWMGSYFNTLLGIFSVGPYTMSLNALFSYCCLPWAYLMGFVGTQAHQVAQLIGTKIAINELIAYGKLVTFNFDERTTAIVTYALCGFSNFSCIGIQIGGIGGLIPQRRQLLSSLGVRAVIGAALANILSALVAGLLL